VRVVLAYAAAGLAVLAAKLPTLTDGVVFIDEPYYLAAASRLDSVGTFLRSFTVLAETKSGYALLPHIVANGIGGAHPVLVLHLLGLVFGVATAALLVALSREAYGSALPGVAAAVVWAGWLTKDSTTAVVNLEQFQAPFVVVAILLALRRRASLATLAAAGAALGFAALVKPPALLVLPVLMAAVAPRLRAMGALAAGVALPLAVLAAPYLLTPSTLGEARFVLVDLPRIYAGFSGGSTSEHAEALLSSIPWSIRVLVLVAALHLLWVRLRARSGVEAPAHWREELTLLGAGVALFAAHVSGQLKLHYMVVILPPLLLFVAGRAQLALPAARVPRLAAAAAGAGAVALVLATGTASASYWRALLRDGGGLYAAQMPAVDVDALVAYTRRQTRPGDRIWVYYNAPEVYVRADRAPASEDLVASWLTHDYGPLWLGRDLADLERERPRLIAGLVAPRYPEPVPPLEALPGIGALIARSYACDRTAVRGAVVCVRGSVSGSERSPLPARAARRASRAVAPSAAAPTSSG
jgi:hypothetical protein